MSAYIIQNEKHLAKLGAVIAKTIQSGDVILLSGEIGTGKTTLVRKICTALKCAQHVHSPSFTLVNQYESDQKTIYHIDLYRTNSERELDLLDLDHYYENPKAIIFIEWAEKLGALTPKEYFQIHLEYLEKNKRKLTLKHKGKRYQPLKIAIEQAIDLGPRTSDLGRT